MTRKELIDKIDKTSITDDEGFWQIMSAIIDDGYFTEQSLANELPISKPTIMRWKARTTAPHTAMRKSLYDYLVKVLVSAMTKRVCTKDHPFDVTSKVKDDEYWEHLDGELADSDYPGEILFFHCPNCGLDWSIDPR